MSNTLKQKIKIKFPWLVDFSHKARGILAYYLNGAPSKALQVIGVIGTNGKTTTCYMITAILEAAGERVGMASTTSFKVGSKQWTNVSNMTTVNPFFLQRLLKQMVKEKCRFAVVETTSHAVAQYRNWGIRYQAAAMTNVVHEHLDYHKTFKEYVQTKARMFSRLPRLAVVNSDDPSAGEFLRYKAGKQLTYSMEKRADVVARKILPDRNGTIFTLVLPNTQLTVNHAMVGLFNVSNALCAAAVCWGLGISPEAIKKGLESLKSVPGRMEPVEAGQDFTFLIDYAVTPDSLEKLYSTLKPGISGRLFAILGSCGDRDRTKRPIMGAVAGRFADVVIVTDEDPYTEDPQAIIEEVAKGVPKGSKTNKMVLGENFFKILDRREAIAKAISMAQRGDLIVITGMGAQEYKVVQGKKVPWQERAVILEELAKAGFEKK